MIKSSNTNLHQHSRPQVFVSIPPVARAARAAARTQDAFIQSILHRRKEYEKNLISESLVGENSSVMQSKGCDVPVFVCPPQSEGIALSPRLIHPSSSGKVQ